MDCNDSIFCLWIAISYVKFLWNSFCPRWRRFPWEWPQEGDTAIHIIFPLHTMPYQVTRLSSFFTPVIYILDLRLIFPCPHPLPRSYSPFTPLEGQCCGSVTFWYHFGSADPYHWPTDSGSDPDPDPAFFVSDLQNKKYFFFLSFLLICVKNDDGSGRSKNRREFYGSRSTTLLESRIRNKLELKVTSGWQPEYLK